MRIALNFYFIFEICIVILAVISYVFWDKRYRENHGLDIPEGFEKTEEINIDPSDGRRLRVYYNSRTGERFYHEEKGRMKIGLRYYYSQSYLSLYINM